MGVLSKGTPVCDGFHSNRALAQLRLFCFLGLVNTVQVLLNIVCFVLEFFIIYLTVLVPVCPHLHQLRACWYYAPTYLSTVVCHIAQCECGFIVAYVDISDSVAERGHVTPENMKSVIKRNEELVESLVCWNHIKATRGQLYGCLANTIQRRCLVGWHQRGRSCLCFVSHGAFSPQPLRPTGTSTPNCKHNFPRNISGSRTQRADVQSPNLSRVTPPATLGNSSPRGRAPVPSEALATAPPLRLK